MRKEIFFGLPHTQFSIQGKVRTLFTKSSCFTDECKQSFIGQLCVLKPTKIVALKSLNFNNLSLDAVVQLGILRTLGCTT